MKYDWFVAGRTRNKDVIENVLRVIRDNNQSAWSFIEKSYLYDDNSKVDFRGSGEQAITQFEQLDLNDDFVKKIFVDDLNAERDSKNFLLVLPAGISGHVEAGIAYGMGRKCYALGVPEKTESLYHIFDKIFANFDEFEKFLQEEK